MNITDQIIKALGSVSVDDLPRLLVAVLQNAREDQVVDALQETHPTLLETSE